MKVADHRYSFGEQMHKTTAIALASLGLVSLCSAREVGIGMSLKQNENTVFFPMKTSQGMLIEGFVRYSHANQSRTDPGGEASQSYSILEPGVGIFWLKPVTDNSHIYFGPRLGYTTAKQSNRFLDSRSDYKSHGYRVCPTLGFEYFPVKHISIGGEVGYNYTKTSGSSTFDAPSGSVSYDFADNGTVTSVIVRFYF